MGKKISPQKEPDQPIFVEKRIPAIKNEYKLILNASTESKLPTFEEGTTISPTDLLAANFRPTYARAVGPNDGNIEWEKCTAIQVYNKWRAFCKKPGLFTFMNFPPGSNNVKRVKILELLRPEYGSTSLGEVTPGEVSFSKGDPYLKIQTSKYGDPVLCTRIQVEGKSVMDGKTFYNGYMGPAKLNKFVFHTGNCEKE